MAAKIAGVLSSDLSDVINASKILVVGAGGIGCEILKNLVMSGFSEIEIIDLDTIDVSNLNRQFLFHKEHVGKSKAVVAKESALSFNPNVNITAYHDSITSTNYGVGFFKRFNLVLNALDNRQARNHVNRMCLTADIPLIESGTAGYNGQVELIKKGLTQCYECSPKAVQKTYPGCTIRNTPSEPIHCIVWSKHLFNQLFGENNADEDVSPDTADPEATADAGTDALTSESNEKGNVERVSTRAWAQNCKYDPEKLFNKLFHDDIKYLLSMANLWKNRVPPKPLKWNDLSQPGTSDKQNSNVLPDQKIWNLQECAKIFAQSINSLKESFYKLAEGDHLVWDKDDKYAMDFVASCANIRSYIYNIQQKSRFDIKSMAGNIIPAIATTNAITAGFVLMHAFNVLLNNYEKCHSVYMRLGPNGRNQLFVPEKTSIKPNPKCYVCSPKPEIVVKIDTNKLTVEEFKNDVLIKALNMVHPDVIIDGKGVIVISSEEGETDCNNNKKLHDMGVVDGCILKVDDFFQNYELSITIVHHTAERDEPDFEVIADAEMLKPKEDNGNVESVVESNNSTDDVEMLEEKETTNPNNVAEEKVENLVISLNDDDDEVVAVKKPRPNDDEDDDDCCIIGDSDEEADVVEVPLETTSNQSTQNSNNTKQKKHKLFDKETGELPQKRARIEINSDDDDDDDFDEDNGDDDDVITLD